jgi:hypothetical protein
MCECECECVSGSSEKGEVSYLWDSLPSLRGKVKPL